MKNLTGNLLSTKTKTVPPNGLPTNYKQQLRREDREGLIKGTQNC